MNEPKSRPHAEIVGWPTALQMDKYRAVARAAVARAAEAQQEPQP